MLFLEKNKIFAYLKIDMAIEFDESTLDHVSKLARLSLNEFEKKQFVDQLKDVLSIFSRIDKEDTEKVLPAFHPIDQEGAPREDRAEKWQWDPLESSKLNEGKYIKSPKIV
ncbi:MAG: Asp-tRNA(Asn)/Glu-tRNA(Gln) amidotransferase subunit GatC [Candidatus Micrarchaeia archaeon]